MSELLVRGKYVITDASVGEEGILNDAAIYISKGKIVEVGDYKALKEKYPKVEVKGNGRQLLMPGLIDGHSHGEGLTTAQRGQPFDYLENGLIDWAGLVEIDPELDAMLSAIRHLRNGCTTMHHNNWGEDPKALEIADATIQGYKKTGIRLAYSPGARNMNTLALDDTAFFETLPADLQEFARPMVYYDKQETEDLFFHVFDTLYDKYNDEDTRIILGPSWAHGSTPEFLQRVKSRADELDKVPIHIHTLQTPLQKAYGLKTFGKSLVKHLDDLGVVDSNLTLGHAVYVNELDIELLAAKGASITNHASCNLAVRNGIAPVYYLHKAGVNVALGIDDKAINDDEDAIMELRMIHKLHRVPGFDLKNMPALNAFEVLKIGTINAAKVCGFEGETGQLKTGMKADMILVDLKEMMEDPWMSPDINIAEIFIHRAMGKHVDTTIVGGKVVMEDRKFKTIDIESLYKEVRKQASKGQSAEEKEFAQNLLKIKPYYHKWYEHYLDDIDFDPFYIMNSKK